MSQRPAGLEAPSQNPRAILVSAAAAELWVRETSKNQGPGIQKYWAATSYPSGYQNREPYCAAFVCWLIWTAMQSGFALGLTNSTRPKSAAVRLFVEWAKLSTSGCLVFYSNSTDFQPQPGDLVWFRFGGKWPDHIAVVESFDETRGIVGTIEANTDGSGAREGDGVYRRNRKLSGCAGFIRVAWRAQKV